MSILTSSAVRIASVGSKVSKPYLHEINFLRAITTFTVVAVHSISSTSYLAANTLESELIGVMDHSLNYNRELFMFVTGLLLTYVYFNRPHFKSTIFWKKRLFLIFIPYFVWTLFYTLLNTFSSNVWTNVSNILLNTLTGNASSQLYYIVLALQFYAIFPLFLMFIQKVRAHPWITLGISLAAQLLFIALDYFYIQTGPLSHEAYAGFIIKYQNRVFPTYQFFFILGGFAAVYMNSIRSFFVRFGKYMPIAMVASLGVYVGYYFLQIHALHQSIWSSGDVLQPSVVLYSTVVIVFIGWLSTIWVKKQKYKKIIDLISESSFGIYFIHVLILTLVNDYITPLITTIAPLPVTSLLVVLLTFFLSLGICYAFLKTKLLSWTIGKPIRWNFMRNDRKINTTITS